MLAILNGLAGLVVKGLVALADSDAGRFLARIGRTVAVAGVMVFAVEAMPVLLLPAVAVTVVVAVVG